MWFTEVQHIVHKYVMIVIRGVKLDHEYWYEQVPKLEEASLEG
jgi:hypothetical protein